MIKQTTTKMNKLYNQDLFANIKRGVISRRDVYDYSQIVQTQQRKERVTAEVLRLPGKTRLMIVDPRLIYLLGKRVRELCPPGSF